MNRLALMYRWHIRRALMMLAALMLVGLSFICTTSAIAAIVDLNDRAVSAENAAHDALEALSGRVTLAEEPNSRYRFLVQMELQDMGEQRGRELMR